MRRRINSRKTRCERCGVGGGSRHSKACKFAYIPEADSKSIKKRFSWSEKLKIIIEIIKA